MDRTKKILIGLLLLGALATIGVGTFASFNASTSNTNNTFQTGTIAINETQPAGQVCTSYDTPTGFTTNNNTTTCNINLVNTTTPATAVQHTVIGIQDNGTLNGNLFISGACTSSAVNAGGIYGSGNLCAYIGLTISPCTAYTSGSTCTTSTTSCTFPASATQPCSTWEAAGPGNNQIDPLLAAGTGSVKADWADFATAFATPQTTGAITAGAANTRYFQIDYELFDHNQGGGSGADNPVQGLKAQTNITFTLQ